MNGFLKGFGKGIGGFATQPNATLMGVLGYTMKGIHKEVQNLLGSNVHSHIVASRVTQGYEEWLQSSVAEKEDVADRWKLIQIFLKRKHNCDEMVRDVLEAQAQRDVGDREAMSSAQSVGAVAPIHDVEIAFPATDLSQSPLSSASTATEQTRLPNNLWEQPELMKPSDC